jgi:Kef-type K+ transport system membrane component KefB
LTPGFHSFPFTSLTPSFHSLSAFLVSPPSPRLSLSLSAIDDVLAWCTLALTLSYVSAGNFLGGLYVALIAVAFILFEVWFPSLFQFASVFTLLCVFFFAFRLFSPFLLFCPLSSSLLSLSFLFLFSFQALVLGKLLTWWHSRLLTKGDENNRTFLAFIFFHMCLGAWFAEIAGIHAFFGAFVAGGVIPKAG